MNTANPFVEKMDFCKGGDNGYQVFRIPGLITTKGNVIIAWYDGRLGQGGDWDPIDILMRRSFDNGLTWEAEGRLVDYREYGVENPINNLIMIADQQTGDVHVLFCRNYEQMYYMKSSDDGLTFGHPVEITAVMEHYRDRYNWRVIAPGPGHGIQLQNGRLVVPVWMSTGEGHEFGDPRVKGHRPSDLAVIYSDDHGVTWQPGDFVVRTQDGYLHPNETAPVELSDGRVLFNIRTEANEHRRLIAISPDGAFQWSKPHFDLTLTEPICFGSIIKYPASSAHPTPPIIFVNPDSQEKGYVTNVSETVKVQTCKRQNLTIRASLDDCRTWTYSQVLDPGISSYSDLTIAPDGTILCLYERGAATDDGTEFYLTLACFNWEWVVS